VEFQKINFDNSKPLYLQVSDFLEKKITTGEIKVGEKLPPEKDLRKTINVSIDTMREALSKLEKHGYLSRRPNHGTFVISSSPVAETGSIVKNGICLLMFPMGETSTYPDVLAHPQGARIIKGIEEKVREQNSFLIYKTLNGKDEEIPFNDREKEVSGLITMGCRSQQYLKMLKKTGIPFVMVDELPSKAIVDNGVDVVVDDDFQGAYLATRYLIKLGHRNILFLVESCNHEYFRVERFNGYKLALKENSIPLDKGLVIETGRFDQDLSFTMVNGLLDRSGPDLSAQPPFTAIFCVSNSLCMGAMKALGNRGLRIPDDVSIITVDDLPGFTQVTEDYEEKGRIAFKLLTERIENKNLEPRRIVVPRKLVIGTSTGKLKKRAPKLAAVK